MVVADAHHSFELTGNGDVLEPDHGAIGVGSGGSYALGEIGAIFHCLSVIQGGLILVLCLAPAAALALIDQPGLDAEAVVRKSMKIAGDMDIYTNHNLIVEKIDGPAAAVSPAPNNA